MGINHNKAISFGTLAGKLDEMTSNRLSRWIGDRKVQSSPTNTRKSHQNQYKTDTFSNEFCQPKEAPNLFGNLKLSLPSDPAVAGNALAYSAYSWCDSDCLPLVGMTPA